MIRLRQRSAHDFVIYQQHDRRQQFVPIASLTLLNQPRELFDGPSVEVLALLPANADPSELKMRTRQGIDGVHNGWTAPAQGQDELLERVPILLAKHNEMGEDVAEMVDKGAAVLARRELSKRWVTKLEMW